MRPTAPPSSDSAQRLLLAIGSAAMLASVWLLTHRYEGIKSDAKLYAVQALAQLFPAYNSDVYLQMGSQDHFTMFSRLYAAVIQLLGLNAAAMSLMMLCIAAFIVCSWLQVRRYCATETAFLAVALLLIVPSSYGAYEVFYYQESFLTARSVAQTMIVGALTLQAFEHPRWAIALALAAIPIHPLMALPGLLLLMALQCRLRDACLGAAAGLLLTLLLAWLGASGAIGGPLAVMDAAWLRVVLERSQFLFPRLWEWGDWEITARPLLSLMFSALVLQATALRRLALCAALVGIAGIGVAIIAAAIGPVALLLQGQAWRWMWIACFVAGVLLAPTMLVAWRDRRCGPACAIGVLAGWTFPQADPTLCFVIVLAIWSARDRITNHVAQYLRWLAAGLAVLMLAWAAANCFTVANSQFNAGSGALNIQHLKDMAGLRVPAVMLVLAGWYALRQTRQLHSAALLAAVPLVLSVVLLPAAFADTGSAGSAAEIRAFSDWRERIPTTANVYTADGHDTASFAWFSLGRPSYLSIDQSAGVVFSRATALEIARRSEDLAPLIDPDWMLQTRIREDRNNKTKIQPQLMRELTRPILLQVCADPDLGFLIGSRDVGFEPLRHRARGALFGWYLYDCANVRAAVTP